MQEARRLRDKVDELIEKWSKTSQEPGITVEFVRVGLNRGREVSLKHYAHILLEKGLCPERVSEIRTILRHDDVAREFVAGKLAVKEALKTARGKPKDENEEQTPETRESSPPAAPAPGAPENLDEELPAVRSARDKMAKTLASLCRLMHKALEKHNLDTPKNAKDQYELECGPFVLRYTPPSGASEQAGPGPQ